MASYVRSLASYLVAQFDARVADQETREQFYKKIVVFSRQQPFIASFIAIQLLFGILPVLGLLGFALGVVGLALGFCAFWIGFGLCIMFSILTVTATVATCVWFSGVASLLCFRWILNILSGSPSSPAPAKTTRRERISEGKKKKPADNVALAGGDQGQSQNGNTTRSGDNGDSPVKVEHNGLSEKVYGEDEESDDTFGRLSDFTKRAKNEEPKWVRPDAPLPLSEADKMRRDIERSLQ